MELFCQSAIGLMKCFFIKKKINFINTSLLFFGQKYKFIAIAITDKILISTELIKRSTIYYKKKIIA